MIKVPLLLAGPRDVGHKLSTGSTGLVELVPGATGQRLPKQQLHPIAAKAAEPKAAPGMGAAPTPPALPGCWRLPRQFLCAPKASPQH